MRHQLHIHARAAGIRKENANGEGVVSIADEPELVRSGSEPVEPVPARRIAERGAPARFGDLHPRQGAPGGAVPDRAPHSPWVRDLRRRTESLEQQHEWDQEHQRLAGRVRTAGAAGSGEYEYIKDRRPHSQNHIPDHTPKRTSCRFTRLVGHLPPAQARG